MKVAILAPVEEAVPPRTYGGTELVVFHLVEQLQKLGHDVTLFAAGDSKVSATLEPIFERSIRTWPECQDPAIRDALKFIAMGRVVEALANCDFDVIHNNIGWRILPFANVINAPIVTTLHGPLTFKTHAYVYEQFKDLSYVSISNAQRKPLPTLNFVGTVYNGIDCATFKYSETPDDYFAFLGRLSPEKGALDAIRAAKACGVRLRMAAKIDAADRAYYENSIKPLIDGKQIEYIGEVNHAEKNELLRNARGLLFPINWEEPFGLVMIEALASGCPVLANARGSVPEVVDSSVGFVLHSHGELCDAIRRVDSVNRRHCREYACRHFDCSMMAKNYLKLFDRIGQESSRAIV